MKKQKNAPRVLIVAKRMVHFNLLFPHFLFVHSFVVLGAVLKCSLLKIAHDKYRAQKRSHNPITTVQEMFHSARQSNPEVGPIVNSYSEILNPVRVMELFERIPQEVR